MKVLIVDDDPGTLNALRIGLISRGFHVEAALSGIKALDIIKASLSDNEPFALLITDFRMPRMDGLKLIDSARKLFPELITILITGYGSEDLREDSDRIGVSGYLEKPFTPDMLVRKVDEVLQETWSDTRLAPQDPAQAKQSASAAALKTRTCD